jgi:phosphoenolpyruvate carboxylase
MIVRAGSGPSDIEDARWSDLALLAEIHEQVLREAGRSEVAQLLVLLQTDAPTADRLVDELDVADAEHLARALTVHLHLVNLADERHRARLLQGSTLGADADAGDALWPAVSAAGDHVRAMLDRLEIHPVLTAHPTEARRRAVATALRRIADQLQRHDDPRVGDDERFVARRRLLEEIDLLYRTSVLRATRPGPLDEVRTIMTVFDQTLFRAVPRLYRATEATLVGDASGSVPPPFLPSCGSGPGWAGIATAIPSSRPTSRGRRWALMPSTRCGGSARRRCGSVGR